MGAVLALAILIGPAASAATAPFRDVAGLWDANDVALLASAGVVTGEPGGFFRPYNPVNRAAFAAMLERTLKPPEPTKAPRFVDVTARSWAEPVVAAVYAAGWMKGVGHGRFAPAADVTRAQAVTALARALRLPAAPVHLTFTDAAKIPTWARSAVAAGVAAGLVHGFPGGTFRPLARLNRADAAHLFTLVLKRLHTPPAPTGLYLTTYRNHADVVWQSVYDAVYYQVQRQVPGGTWKPVGSTRDHVWGDYHASPTTAYRYRVLAVSQEGFASAPSAAIAEPDLTAEEAGWTRWGFSVSTRLALQVARTAAPGTPLGLGGLAVTKLPRLQAVTTTPTGAPTLLFSDSPETVTRPAVLYQGTASGHVRLYYDHTNATGATAHFAVLITNPGTAPVTYAVNRWLETTSGGPKFEGATVARGLLTPPSFVVANGTIAPGRTVALDPGEASIPIPDGGGVQGAYDATFSGPLRVSFTMLDSAQAVAPARALAQLRLAAPGDGAGRGTYRGAARDIALHLSAIQPEAVVLADGQTDPYVTGTDQTSGRASRDYGNYGVAYHISGTPAVDTALIAVPIGGEYIGALGEGGRAITAPPYVLPSDGSTGFLVGIWKAGQPGSFDWVPPAAADLPLLLVSVPLD